MQASYALPSSSPAAAETAACFHCGQPVPAGARLEVTYENAPRALCCGGCQAVTRAILDAGLGDYYRARTRAAATAEEVVPARLRELSVYDHPRLQRSFVRDLGGRTREATLLLEGITCPACVWLNERQLRRLPGVQAVRINYATRRAQIVWDEARLRLSEILRAVREIGYSAWPYDAARRQRLLAAERRTLLKRLGVAGVMAAQTMTLSVALYVGDWAGSDAGLRAFFHWISLALTLPVVAYSAQPFFRGAWNDLRRRRPGMDVPIALGMGGAFAASVWATVAGAGTVYYDSVAMFAFFLLGGRYFETAARLRASESADALVQASPAVATRLAAGDAPQQVPVAELAPGDRVLVRPGEPVPADGVVIAGRSSVNEAILTGESAPLPKAAGDRVIGGSVNVESPLELRVERVGADTVLSAVLRLLDRAQAEKPRLAQLADRVGAWFVAAMLAVTALVGVYWWHADPAQTLPILIAVLIVTCPCALGLATPTAAAAATGALVRLGVLATRGHALETLARATHFVFDKTGTLTCGEPRLVAVRPLADLDAGQCLARAAALEQHSEHPLARAVGAAAGVLALPRAEDVHNLPGEGLEGTIEGRRHYLGTGAFVRRRTGLAAADPAADAPAATVVVLADPDRVLATLAFDDAIRPGAAQLIAALKRAGKAVALLSGDAAPAVRRVAQTLGIPEAHAAQKPEDKLAYLRGLQARGAVVAMVGDGVNDAPVLAGAQISIAIGGGAHVAAAASDMLLLTPNLGRLADAWRTSRRALRIIRQNLAWAVAYNLLAVPAAAAGFVTPWLAALGMSASSALVVANSLRLAAKDARAREVARA